MAVNCLCRWLASALWVTLALSGTPLAAQEKSDISISDAFGRFGYTTDRVPGNACGIVMSLDREAFIRAVPLLKAMELLNPEYVTQTRLNTEPTTLATGFAIQMAPLVVKELYDKSKGITNCSFQQVIKIQDDYGNDKTEVLFSFDFSQDLYKKINWDKFTAQNIIKVAPKFAFGIPAMLQIKKEKAAAGE